MTGDIHCVGTLLELILIAEVLNVYLLRHAGAHQAQTPMLCYN